MIVRLRTLGPTRSVTVGEPRRRSRAAGAITWLLTQPFGPLFRILDHVAPMRLPLRGRDAPNGSADPKPK